MLFQTKISMVGYLTRQTVSPALPLYIIVPVEQKYSFSHTQEYEHEYGVQ